MKVSWYLVSIIWLFNTKYGYSREIQKRQLYREQVLPHAGGKIPDSAFQTDRLALNRLQKEGIAVPDGIILEQRNPQVYHYTNKAIRPVYRVALSPDNRYTPREGRYMHKEAPSVDTTYSIPQVSYTDLTVPFKRTIQPSVKELVIPNTHQTYNNVRNYINPNGYNTLTSYHIPYRIHSYSGIARLPIIELPSYQWSFFQNDYVASNIFNDFETFFSQFAQDIRKSALHHH